MTMRSDVFRRLMLTGAATSAVLTAAACNPHGVTPFSENIAAENADTFAQAGAAQVDILWVVDNSGSMCEEQLSLRENFDAFIEELGAIGADFQLAVVTTDMVDPEESGRFQNVPDGVPGPSCNIAIDISECPSPDNGQDFPPLILRSRDYQNENGALDVQRLKRDFGCNATVGTQGDGFEMGLESAKEALSPALLNGFNAGFLRPDAFLAVIFLTDENDCSDRGALDRVNGNVCEWESDKLVPVDEYVNFFADLKGGDKSKVIMAGIIGPDDGSRYDPGDPVQPTCFSDAGGDGFAGYRYESVINAFENNEISNICTPPFDDALEALGLLIRDTIEVSCLAEKPVTCESADDCGAGQTCDSRGGDRRFCSAFTVQVEIRRPTPLEGYECTPLANSGQLACLLVEDQDYTLNYNDSQCAASAISINLQYQLESTDTLILRYPREVALNPADTNTPEPEEGE